MESATNFLTDLAKLVTPLLLVVLAIQQYWSKRAADKRGKLAEESAGNAQAAATHAAEKAVEVADKTEAVRRSLVQSNRTTSDKLDYQTEQIDKIHTLTNSNMGLQLRIAATFARRIAHLTGSATDISVAEEHEQLAHDHEQKQIRVDRKEALTEAAQPA